MHDLYPSLPPELQVRVLQTMALLWRCDPPRHDISLEAISEALLSAEQLLTGARQGRWAESDIRSLEVRIAAVGGCLAPGLRSSGPESLQSWRQEIHGRLRSLFELPVLAAAEAAFGPLLQHHQPADLPACFALLRQELAPLLQEHPAPWLDALLALAPERQVAVFRAWQVSDAGVQPPPSLLQQLQSELQPQAGLVAVQPEAMQPATDLAVLERYEVTADALRRRIVSDLLSSVIFPEHAMADVISELMKDLDIPPPYPSRLDPEWLLTLSAETRVALIESWDDLRLRRWIETNLHERASDHFHQRAADFDRYVYECIQLSDVEMAHKLHQLLAISESNFGQLATRYSEGEERWTRGLVGPVQASALGPELRSLLTRLRPGEIHPPCRLDGDLRIVRLLHHFPASLDQSLCRQLMWEIFEQDLDASVMHHLDQIEQSVGDLPALFQSFSLLPPRPDNTLQGLK
ncbi:DUF445 domain-containing protein [Cyanobium sp. Cruz-8H5]|uniref:DUF445 domain-containing protein n=2 Tax=unclassified Cyanobium TaxID=2627006 RepID=UPI0020CE901E|nr:DUF445 domain-containing protein [Cyanobium sp. Cruz-8H5]MCP9859324.1 hypothetical protein [Cyanobium sp. Cruz-8H5]MCP9866650.1 hypothetical protein [Cyanobium sp. Cruz-8D1]